MFCSFVWNVVDEGNLWRRSYVIWYGQMARSPIILPVIDYFALIGRSFYVILGDFLPLILHHLFEHFSLTSDKLLSLCWLSIIFLYFSSFLWIMVHKYLDSFFQIWPLNLLYLAHQLLLQNPPESFLINEVHRLHIDQLQCQNTKRVVIRQMLIIRINQVILI